jgi:hypothetical protein
MLIRLPCRALHAAPILAGLLIVACGGGADDVVGSGGGGQPPGAPSGATTSTATGGQTTTDTGSGGSGSGALTHGGTFTIHHEDGGFGEKQNGATYKFDDASGTNPLSVWDFAIPGPEHNGAYSVGYRAPDEVSALKDSGEAPEPPHARVGRYLAGAHYADDEASNFYSWNVMVGVDGQEDVERAYVAYYMRIDPDWSFDDVAGPEGDHNFKETQMAAGEGPWGTSGDNWYYGLFGIDGAGVQIAFNPETLATPISSANPAVVSFYPETGAAFSTVSFTNPRDSWVKIELLLEHDKAGGIHRVWADNVLQWDVTLDDDNGVSPSARSRTIVGGYAREDGAEPRYRNNFRYYADIYYDTSWARVVLADTETYEAATVVEAQPIVSWSDSEIVVTVNLGRLAAGPAYLHVFDADGNHVEARAVDID